MPEVESFGEAKILIWILTTILGLLAASSLWFLKRYFKEQDAETETVKKKLSSHESRMEKLAEKMEANSSKISEDVQVFKSSALDFQGKLNATVADLKIYSMNSQEKIREDLSDLEKHTRRIESIMDRTAEKATDFGQKVDRSGTQIKEVMIHVENHAKILRAFADVVKSQKIGIEELKQDFRTTKTQLNDNMILIKAKKSGEDPK